MYPYVNSTTHRCPNKIFKTFLIEDFWHLPPMTTTVVVLLELWISSWIFEKIQNGPYGLLRGLGETDSWRNLKSKISWYCPLARLCVSRNPWFQKIVSYLFCSKNYSYSVSANTDSFTLEWLPGHAKLANNWPPAVHCFSAASHLQIVPCGNRLHETCIKLIGMRLWLAATLVQFVNLYATGCQTAEK